MTLLATTILDVPFGLGLGILTAILSVILQGFIVKGHQLTPPQENSDLYVAANMYECTVDSAVRVFRYESNLYFVTAADFKQQLCAATLNPQKLALQQEQREKEGRKAEKTAGTMANNQTAMKLSNDIDMVNNNTKDITENITEKQGDEDQHNISGIVLDCSAISYIDVMGLNAIEQMFNDFKGVNIPLALAACNNTLLKKLEGRNLYGDDKVELQIFATVHDAVTRLSENQTNLSEHETSLSEIETRAGNETGLPENERQSESGPRLSENETELNEMENPVVTINNDTDNHRLSSYL